MLYFYNFVSIYLVPFLNLLISQFHFDNFISIENSISRIRKLEHWNKNTQVRIGKLGYESGDRKVRMKNKKEKKNLELVNQVTLLTNQDTRGRYNNSLPLRNFSSFSLFIHYIVRHVSWHLWRCIVMCPQ